MVRRILPIATIAGVFSVALAGSAVAGGGGGGFGVPGRTSQAQHSAFAFLQDPSGNVQVNGNASGGVLTFKAKRTAGPPTSTPGTMVQISVGGQNQGAFGCWVIPDSMFTVNRDLSAALQFRSDAPGVTPCPGFALASGFPASGVVPFGGGGGGGFIGPVSLDLTWLASSPLYDARSTSNARCGAFSGNSTMTFDDNFGASANGTVSATLAGFDSLGNPIAVPVNATLISQFADVNVFDSKSVVNGPTTGSCGPFGS